MGCTIESHERLKADVALWYVSTVPPPGHSIHPVQDGGDRWLQIGNCKACGSTLARVVEVNLGPRPSTVRL